MAKLAVTHQQEPKSVAVVDEAWLAVREAFVKQMSARDQQGLRLDLGDLFDNTKVHAATRTRIKK